MEMNDINIIDKLIGGIRNASYLSCRYLHTCWIRAVPLLFGKGDVPSKDKYIAIEDQKDIIEKANEMGHKIRQILVK